MTAVKVAVFPVSLDNPPPYYRTRRGWSSTHLPQKTGHTQATIMTSRSARSSHQTGQIAFTFTINLLQSTTKPITHYFIKALGGQNTTTVATRLRSLVDQTILLRWHWIHHVELPLTDVRTKTCPDISFLSGDVPKEVIFTSHRRMATQTDWRLQSPKQALAARHMYVSWTSVFWKKGPLDALLHPGICQMMHLSTFVESQHF